MSLSKAQNSRFSLENRRYIGCKSKLIDWIFNLIENNTEEVHSFCDIFAGTGVVAHKALMKYEHVVINDFLYSNNIIYHAFFSPEKWDEKRVVELIDEFNQIDVSNVDDNYFSMNFGNKFFDYKTAKWIGYVREKLQNLRLCLTNKEFSILLASLIYSIDKMANTLGHFDAYIKKEIQEKPYNLKIIDVDSFPGVEIFRKDANQLSRDVHVDLTYIDPPYNSRQYSRFYHVYENLVQWNKPSLYGKAMKPKAELMSEYCRVSALDAFTDLIAHLDTKYLVVSYNNTYRSKSSSSKNKISLEELENVLRKCGTTKIFSHQFKPFNSGKTDFDDHREYLFITKVDNERRNSSFSSLLCGGQV